MNSSRNQHRQSPANNLPLELVDLIVDNMVLEENADWDVASLEACTLLSRRWRVSAQAALFTKMISVFSEPPQENSRFMLDAFAAFLASDTTSNAASYIKKLYVRGRTGTENMLTVKDIDLVLVNIPRLERLELEDLRLTTCLSSTSIECWRHPRNVQHIVFHKVQLVTGRSESAAATHENELTVISLAQWLNLFGYIDVLELDDCICAEDEGDLSRDAAATLADTVSIKGIGRSLI